MRPVTSPHGLAPKGKHIPWQGPHIQWKSKVCVESFIATSLRMLVNAEAESVDAWRGMRGGSM